MSNDIPQWILSLEQEDFSFIKNFILSSGSLKEIANLYNVTYPTVRLRLDKLIQKINILDKTQEDPYITLIKSLALDEKIDFNIAKLLISKYKNKEEI